MRPGRGADHGVDGPHYARATVKKAEESAALPRLYEELAAELGVAFADSSVWQIAMGADGVHFSPRGHLVYAVKMAQTIRALGL